MSLNKFLPTRRKIILTLAINVIGFIIWFQFSEVFLCRNTACDLCPPELRSSLPDLVPQTCCSCGPDFFGLLGDLSIILLGLLAVYLLLSFFTKDNS